MKLYHSISEKAKAESKHFLKYNENYVRVCTYREGSTITAEQREILITSKIKRKTDKRCHSPAKLRTFNKNRFDIDPESTHGTPYFFTLKPVAEIEPKQFFDAMKRLTAKLRYDNAEYIYALEWAAFELAPHIHLVANIPGETTSELQVYAKSIMHLWLKNTSIKQQARIKQDARPIYYSTGLFNYMSKEVVETFNERAIATGKDWSIISVTGCSRGWKRFETRIVEISRDTKSETKRKLKGIVRSRGIELKTKKPKGCDGEIKKALSEVTSFTVAGLSPQEIEQLLAQTIDSQSMKESKYIKELRDLYRKAHSLDAENAKVAIHNTLLDKGYDMRHMYPVWEKPPLTLSERYEADSLFKLVCKAKKKVKQHRRTSSNIC